MRQEGSALTLRTALRYVFLIAICALFFWKHMYSTLEACFWHSSNPTNEGIRFGFLDSMAVWGRAARLHILQVPSGLNTKLASHKHDLSNSSL